MLANRLTAAGDVPMTDVPNPSGVLLANANDVSIIDSARAPDGVSGIPPVPQCMRPGRAMPVDEVSYVKPALDAGGACVSKFSAATATKSVTSAPNACAPAADRTAGGAVQASPCHP